MDLKSLLGSSGLNLSNLGLDAEKLAENLKAAALKMSEFKFSLSPVLMEACKAANKNPNDFLPSQSEPTATGWDIRCGEVDGVEISPGCYKLIDSGLRMVAPPGFWAEVRPRSSTFTKLHLNVLNGVIDNAYTGAIKVACQYLPDACKFLEQNARQKIEFGDRIAQLIPHRIEPISVTRIEEDLFQQLSVERAKQRDPSGFGSSGTK